MKLTKRIILFVFRKVKKLNKVWRDILINWLAASFLLPYEGRYLIYRLYGIKVSTRRIEPGCYFEGWYPKYMKQIRIGANTFINSKCFFSCSAPIEIGSNCAIAYGVTLATSTHQIGNKQRRAGKTIGYPIKIGDGCWIGANTTILPGVTIANGCIIAAGSVVVENCEPDGLYAGVPAKRIKDLN